MLDMKWIREHPDEVREMLERRRNNFPLGSLLEADSRRRDLLADVEGLKAQRNEGSRRVGEARKKGEDAEGLMEDMRLLGDRVASIDEKISALDLQMEEWLSQIPNRPHASVPVGAGEEDNVVVRTWGEPRTFDFDPKPHWELGETLGILDFERGVKLAESRFTVLKGAGARMERALINFMLDLHTREHGYTEFVPPFLVNSATMRGTGQLPKFAEDLYRCLGDDLWLIPTAEVPLTNLHAGETLLESDLPKLYTAYTPCFRREAGTYGRDVRGILRQHQFSKVELVKLCPPATSYDELETLTANAEKVLQLLELPYRVVSLCTGDMGFSAAKTYDLEVWLPSQGKYREISSCSNCVDFQASRMGTRYRPAGGGKAQFLHTLNGSGIAVGRCLIAVMENYQQADGSVKIPEKLQPWMGGQTLLAC